MIKILTIYFAYFLSLAVLNNNVMAGNGGIDWNYKRISCKNESVVMLVDIFPSFQFRNKKNNSYSLDIMINESTYSKLNFEEKLEDSKRVFYFLNDKKRGATKGNSIDNILKTMFDSINIDYLPTKKSKRILEFSIDSKTSTAQTKFGLVDSKNKSGFHTMDCSIVF